MRARGTIAVVVGLATAIGLATPAAATAAPATEVTGEVHSVRYDAATGITTEVIYTPAAGVSTVELYRRLKAAGVPDLVDPSSRATVQDPFQCYWGTAYALDSGRCPPISWTQDGLVRPRVTIMDYTNSAWPVHAATDTWNQSIAIDVIYGSCGLTGHCVRVHNNDYGPTGWAGGNYRQIDANRHIIDGSARVQLNDYYHRNAPFNTYAGHRSTACHEVGHSIGVGHNMSTSSCMYADQISSNPQYPSSDDFGLLANIVY